MLGLTKSSRAVAPRVRVLLCATLAGTALAVVSTPTNAGTHPGDNGRLAYTTGANVGTILPDGTGPATPVAGSYPDWNADGTKLVFSRSGDLYIADADGSGETQLTSGSATDREPSWAPDGTQVAFMREESNDRDVAVVDVGALTVTEIITGSFQAYFPEWSPDGTKIAYRSNQSGCSSSFCIYIANPDGTGQTELVDSATFRAATQPNWSPDASLVVFVYDDDPDALNFSGGIAVVSAAGGTPTALTNDTATDDAYPVFSPDGSLIAFLRGGSILVMNADGSGSQTAVPNATAVSTSDGLSWAAVVPEEPPTEPPAAQPVVRAPTLTG